MSPHSFALAIAAGAALIAVWIDLRLPGLHPRRVAILFVHMLAATVGADAVAQLLSRPSAALGPEAGPLTSVFVLQFPGLIYAFLVCLWLVRMLRNIGFAGGAR